MSLNAATQHQYYILVVDLEDYYEVYICKACQNNTEFFGCNRGLYVWV